MNAEDRQKLLDKARGGDREALGVLCQDCLRDELLKFVRKKMQEEDEAEDIVQTVFEKLIDHFETFEREDFESFRRFAYTIAHNECIGRIRQRHRYTSYILTKNAFSAMQSSDLPEAVIQRLLPLQDSEVIRHQNFTRRLREELQELHSRDISSLVLKCTEKIERVADQDISELHTQALNQRTLIAERKLYELVYEAIQNALDEEEWRVFRMREFEDRTYREIAEQIDIALSVVHNRHDKIWDKIRENETLRSCWNDLQEDLQQ